jgi:hypothetical protein
MVMGFPDNNTTPVNSEKASTQRQQGLTDEEFKKAMDILTPEIREQMSASEPVEDE